MLTPYTPPSLSNNEEAADADGELQMFWETAFLRGGRVFGKCNSGTLYEKASKGEAKLLDAVANSFFVHSPQGWPIKRSIEAKQICAGKATKTFLCEGTMARHTLKSWACAPCEPHAPHTLEASEDAPLPILFRRFLVEDSMPFSEDNYWVTVWRKCEACQARDEAFKAWVMAAPEEESESEGE